METQKGQQGVGLTSWQLKWIAVISMLMDHIGFIFYPNELWLRCIGRIAFPVFAFLLVEGFFYTRNVQRYMVRLGVFAILSEIPYDLAFRGRLLERSHQNVFLTLFLGVFLMYQLSLPGSWKVRTIKTVLLMWAASALHTDYHSMGVLLIFIYYQMRRRYTQTGERWEKGYVIGVLLSIGWNFLWPGRIQWYGILATPLILLYHGECGKKAKYFFYAFYPMHLLILYMIHRYMS